MHKEYHLTKLDNGVRLLLIPKNGVNSVATAVYVAVGSRYENREINGISHFLEHMVFKGTKKYPTTDDVNVIERTGGLQNAYTDIDITNYHNKVLSADWELALDINKELALWPLLEQKHVDMERSVILEEMKRYEDQPDAKAEETLHTLMYPNTKLGMRVIGEADSLQNTVADTLRQYHDDWYVPEKLVVVLAGDVQSIEHQITKRVEEWFGGLQAKKTGNMEKVELKQTEPQLKVVTKPDAAQAHFLLGLRTFPRGENDRFAWNVFNLLMGVGFTSRLFREVREKRGLCYHVRSESQNWEDAGYWQIYAGVATDRVTEAVKAIIDEMKKVREKGVEKDEIVVSKKRLLTLLSFKAENPEFLAEYYGRQEVFNMPLMTLEEYLEKLNAVTVEDVNKLIKKYFVPNNLNMSLVWNKPEDLSLKTLLSL